MSLQEDFEKIIFETRVEKEMEFLAKTKETLLQLLEGHPIHPSEEKQRILSLVERTIDAEMDFLASEPEDYLELYGE